MSVDWSKRTKPVISVSNFRELCLAATICVQDAEEDLPKGRIDRCAYETHRVRTPFEGTESCDRCFWTKAKHHSSYKDPTSDHVRLETDRVCVRCGDIWVQNYKVPMDAVMRKHTTIGKGAHPDGSLTWLIQRAGLGELWEQMA